MPKKTDELRPATQMVGFQLRFPERFRTQLEKAAKENGNSINTEIISRLERSLEGDFNAGSPQTGRLLSRLAEAIAQAERFTGLHWWSDTATHTAAMKLLTDAMKKAAPLPACITKSESFAAWSERHEELELLIQVLAEYNAMVATKGSVAYFANRLLGPWERPSNEWTMPDGSPLESEDERKQVAEALKRYRRLREEMNDLWKQIEPALQNENDAKRRGEAIYRALTELAQRE